MGIRPISGGSIFANAPVVDMQSGRLVPTAIYWFSDIQSRVQGALDLLGQFIGQLGADATVSGRTGTLGTALQHIDSTGVIAATAISGVISSGVIPAASLGGLGGVTANNPVAHQWINAIDPSGNPTLSQPGFGDIAGSVTPAQLPAPSTSTLGGVKANTPVTHQWVNAISTAGVPQLSQPAFTDVSGSASTAQLPANVPVVSFGTGAPGGSSTEGYIYYDTTGIPFHGYVWHSGAWQIFS